MPNMRVIAKRLPVCPGRDCRFTIKHNQDWPDRPWWVYYDCPGGDPIPADGEHRELIRIVNELKASEGKPPGGSFSINEHGQIIARTWAPTGQGNAVHLIGHEDGQVCTCLDHITFARGRLDPRITPKEGETWPGPVCGMTYSFTAPGNPRPPSLNFDEIFVEVEGSIVLLSRDAHISPYPPTSGPLADFLKALRRQLPRGGKFRVNEQGRAFTSGNLAFVGCIPREQWFKPLSNRS